MSAAAMRHPFEFVLAGLLAAVLAVRTLIPETFGYADQFFLGEISGGPTPATTTLIDALLLALAAVALGLRGPRVSRPGLFAGGLIVAALLVSVLVASDRRLAANAGATLAITLAAGWALDSLRLPRRTASVLLALVLACGAANAARCLAQWSYEFDMTREAWQQRKQELAAAGVDLERPQIVDYERRLASAEAYGYQPGHPNVAAALLTPAVLLGSGAALAILPAPAAALPAALGVLALLGLGLTGSLAGGASLAFGLALGGLLLWRANLSAPSRRLLIAGTHLAIVLGIVGFGLLRGGLPGASLNFRWQYWTGAAGVVSEAPLTGVGRLNFGPRYLLHKPEEATEAVLDPHNVWVTLLSEWGPLGLAGCLLLLWLVLGRIARATTAPPRESSAERSPPLLTITVLLTVAVLQPLLSGTPLLAPGVGVLWLVEFLFVLVAALLLALRCLGEVSRPRIIAVTALAALAANLLHNLVGFSLMTPGGLALFVVIAVIGLLLDPREVALPPLRIRPALLVGGLFVVATHVGLVLLPTMRTDAALAAMRTARGLDASVAAATRLAAADGWDPYGPRAAARHLVGLAIDPRGPIDLRRDLLADAERLAAVGAARDPRDPTTAELRARIAAARADAERDVAARDALLHTATDFWRLTLSGNPARGRLYIEAAATVAARGAVDSATVREALAWLDEAERLDALRAPQSSAKLTATEEVRVAALRATLSAAE